MGEKIATITHQSTYHRAPFLNVNNYMGLFLRSFVKHIIDHIPAQMAQQTVRLEQHRGSQSHQQFAKPKPMAMLMKRVLTQGE